MNCTDVQNAIYVYLDGEFAAPEEAEFRAHLEACPSCRALAGQERSFLRDLRGALETPRAPEGLRERVDNALDVTPAPWLLAELRELGPRRSRWRWAAPMMAAAAAAAILVFAMSSAGQDRAPVVQEAIAAHQNALPMEVRGSAERVRAFLQDNVPFAVKVPFEGVKGVDLVGARLTQYQGKSAVLFNFDAHGRRVSVLQVAEGDDGPDRPAVTAPVVQDRAGFRVVTYRDRGLTNSVVGDVGRDEIRRLVPAAYHP